MNLICPSVFPGYSILFTADPSLPDNQWSLIDVFGDVTSARVPDLQQESTYYFRIQARSNSGDESTSRTVAYRTPDGQCRRTLSASLAVFPSVCSTNFLHMCPSV